MGKKRILIVDDEAGFARLLKHVLKEYDVKIENRPTEAVAAARQFNPDLVLLDVIMPERDGGEVASALRADPNLQTVPIVFLTAIVSEAAGTGDGRIGGFPFLAKPVSPDRLRDCIERNLFTKSAAA